MQILMLFRLMLGRVLVVLVLIGGIVSCSESEASGLAGDPNSIGDPSQGQALIQKLGCGSCHDIPGIIGAHGMVGPPLTRMASRQYVAGVLRNTPENMVHWLRFPQKVVPGNAMPNLGISNRDAQNIAAYLATLK
ncbi:c-type cytochrome [Afipia felis]|nr:c-type cytochrome [Afipia felis]